MPESLLSLPGRINIRPAMIDNYSLPFVSALLRRCIFTHTFNGAAFILESAVCLCVFCVSVNVNRLLVVYLFVYLCIWFYLFIYFASRRRCTWEGEMGDGMQHVRKSSL